MRYWLWNQIYFSYDLHKVAWNLLELIDKINGREKAQSHVGFEPGTFIIRVHYFATWATLIIVEVLWFVAILRKTLNWTETKKCFDVIRNISDLFYFLLSRSLNRSMDWSVRRSLALFLSFSLTYTQLHAFIPSFTLTFIHTHTHIRTPIHTHTHAQLLPHTFPSSYQLTALVSKEVN